jgi:hypothetical protein
VTTGTPVFFWASAIFLLQDSTKDVDLDLFVQRETLCDSRTLKIPFFGIVFVASIGRNLVGTMLYAVENGLIGSCHHHIIISSCIWLDANHNRFSGARVRWDRDENRRKNKSADR